MGKWHKIIKRPFRDTGYIIAMKCSRRRKSNIMFEYSYDTKKINLAFNTYWLNNLGSIIVHVHHYFVQERFYKEALHHIASQRITMLPRCFRHECDVIQPDVMQPRCLWVERTSLLSRERPVGGSFHDPGRSWSERQALTPPHGSTWVLNTSLLTSNTAS